MKRPPAVIIFAISAVALLVSSIALYCVYSVFLSPSTGSFTSFERLECRSFQIDVDSNGNLVAIMHLINTGSVKSTTANFSLNNVPYDSLEEYTTQNIIGTTLEPGQNKIFIIELDKEKWKQDENITLQIQTEAGKNYSYAFQLTTSQQEAQLTFNELECEDVKFNTYPNGNLAIIFDLKYNGAASITVTNFQVYNASYSIVKDYVNQNINGTTFQSGERKTFYIELEQGNWKENETIAIQIQTKERGNYYPHTCTIPFSDPQPEDESLFEKLEYSNPIVDVFSNGNPVIIFDLRNSGTRNSTVENLSLSNIFGVWKDYVNQNVIGTVLNVYEQKTCFIELDKDNWKENENINLEVQTSMGHKYPYSLLLQTSQTSQPASQSTTLVIATSVIIAVASTVALVYLKKHKQNA